MINIQVNQTDLDNILLAFDKVEKSVQRAALRTMTKEAAQEFAGLIKENIMTQKYGDFGKPHKKWKEAYPEYHPNDYWWFLGIVLKSIEVRPIGMSPKMNMVYKVGLAYRGNF